MAIARHGGMANSAQGTLLDVLEFGILSDRNTGSENVPAQHFCFGEGRQAAVPHTEQLPPRPGRLPAIEAV